MDEVFLRAKRHELTMHIDSQFKLFCHPFCRRPLIVIAMGIASATNADQAPTDSELVPIGTSQSQGQIIIVDEPDESGSDEQLRFAPYVGVGLGRSLLKPDTSNAAGVIVTDDEETGFQLTLGVDINKWVSVEVHGADLGRATFSNNGTIDYRQYGISALLYAGKNRSRANRRGWTAFGRAGVGSLDDDASNGLRLESEQDVNFILGAGIEYSTRSGLGLRAEGIAFDTDASYGQLALVYRFGRWPLQSASAASLEMQREKRQRMSGKVDRIPLPEDADGDGIKTADDLCPDTPQAIAVGDNGCAVFAGVVDGLTFAPGSAELTDGARVVLDTIVESMQQIPEERARVSAHTDNQGASDANMQLSRERALSVARYLIQQGGISRDRLEARAFGETRPIDTNSTASGRENNRRVEIDLIAE